MIPELMLPVRVSDKYGYINLRGELVVSPQFDYASDFSEGFAVVRRKYEPNGDEQEYTIMDEQFREQGRLICRSCYHEFSDGLLAFEARDGWGYVDTTLEIVIPPTFRNAHEFVEGLAWASVDITLQSGMGRTAEREGFINRSGEWVIPAQYARVWGFTKGERLTAFTRDRKKWGLVDRQGRELVPPTFDYLHGTSEGLTPAASCTDKVSGAKFGVIDEHGEWVVTPRFDRCDGTFVNGTLGAAIGEYWGVVNQEGGWIIEPRFIYAEAFHEGLSRVYIGGRHDGMGYSGGKCGYIDHDGEFAIEPCFDDAWPFKNGVAKVEFIQSDGESGGNRKIGYIDTQGRYIWEPTR